MKIFVEYTYTKTFMVQGEGEFKSKKDAEKQIREDPADVEDRLCPAQGSTNVIELEIFDVRKP